MFVGDGGQAIFDETNWSITGSLCEPNAPLLDYFKAFLEFVTPVTSHPVEIVRLDAAVEVDDVDLIEIDMQASGHTILMHVTCALSTALFTHTEVEFVPLYEDRPLFGDVNTPIRQHRFKSMWR